jgi:hypothetical protein
VRRTPITLAVAGLLALVALSALDVRAGAWSPRGFEDAASQAPIATPVKVFKDCQEIALCTGCKPRYKCRSCTYQKACSRGLCEWRDICVWGPYVKVLPPNARIIRIR